MLVEACEPEVSWQSVPVPVRFSFSGHPQNRRLLTVAYNLLSMGGGHRDLYEFRLSRSSSSLE